MKKAFIITIDTEADNQWTSNDCETSNAIYLYRFQQLCERYNFKPVYLTDYAMGKSSEFVEWVREVQKKGNCEIGMHLHAWNTPPYYEEIDKKIINRKPYITEYDKYYVNEKIKSLTSVLNIAFDCEIYSHRAGRWSLDNQYLSLLADNGYKIDCSVTPGISWKKHKGFYDNSQGTDFVSYPEKEYLIGDKKDILEVPMTIKKIQIKNFKKINSARDFAKRIYNAFYGKDIWFRPSLSSEKEIMQLIDEKVRDKQNYVEFMMHSSEFMPGGSPYYKNEREIEELYEGLERIFDHVNDFFEGKTLKEFYDEYRVPKI